MSLKINIETKTLTRVRAKIDKELISHHLLLAYKYIITSFRNYLDYDLDYDSNQFATHFACLVKLLCVIY